MPNSRAKGQRNERRAQKLLDEQGFTTFRLYQPSFTKQGPIDIVAVSDRELWLVQVKTNQWQDLRELKALAVPENVKKIVVRFDDGVKEPKIRQLETGGKDR